MPKVAADHPYELALDMLEVGDASTYGTCFDGQNLFDTTHDYGTSAGTQDNVITTGSGVTAAYLITDMGKAIARLNGFYYSQGGTGNSKKRKLNKKLKLLVVCPDELYAVFEQVRTQGTLATGEENVYKGRFELVSRPFSDASDWYLINIDDSDNLGLFLYQVEKPVELDMPTPSDESVRENKIASYGAYGRYTVAYGAWWKGVMINNT
jgi:phage major head subunit gpT-like protein